MRTANAQADKAFGDPQHFSAADGENIGKDRLSSLRLPYLYPAVQSMPNPPEMLGNLGIDTQGETNAEGNKKIMI